MKNVESFEGYPSQKTDDVVLADKEYQQRHLCNGKPASSNTSSLPELCAGNVVVGKLERKYECKMQDYENHGAHRRHFEP